MQLCWYFLDALGASSSIHFCFLLYRKLIDISTFYLDFSRCFDIDHTDHNDWHKSLVNLPPRIHRCSQAWLSTIQAPKFPPPPPTTSPKPWITEQRAFICAGDFLPTKDSPCCKTYKIWKQKSLIKSLGFFTGKPWKKCNQHFTVWWLPCESTCVFCVWWNQYHQSACIMTGMVSWS